MAFNFLLFLEVIFLLYFKVVILIRPNCIIVCNDFDSLSRLFNQLFTTLLFVQYRNSIGCSNIRSTSHCQKYFCCLLVRHTNCSIDLKNVFYVFYYFCKKRVFNVFTFWNVFDFLVEKYFMRLNLHAKILLNLLNFCIKRLLSDGFNMAAIKILSWRAVAFKRFHALLRQ